MALCKCTQLRTVKYFRFWDHVTLQGGGYTLFFILRCMDCGGIYGFPPQNLEIALSIGTDATKKRLAEIIDGEAEDLEKEAGGNEGAAAGD